MGKVVHHGLAESVREKRKGVLVAAYAAHQERFVNGLPRPAELPQAVWINPPLEKTAPQDAPGSTIVTSDDLWVDPIRESQTLITPEALH